MITGRRRWVWRSVIRWVWTAQPLETIWRKSENKLRQTLARIKELTEEYQVERIVLGFPKNMNNTMGDRAVLSLEFQEMLKKRDRPGCCHVGRTADNHGGDGYSWKAASAGRTERKRLTGWQRV